MPRFFEVSAGRYPPAMDMRWNLIFFHRKPADAGLIRHRRYLGPGDQISIEPTLSDGIFSATITFKDGSSGVRNQVTEASIQDMLAHQEIRELPAD